MKSSLGKTTKPAFNLASRLSKQNERYQALRQELNPRTTQVGPSHDPLYRDKDNF